MINQATGVITLQLRAERSGRASGRIYTVLVTATEALEEIMKAINLYWLIFSEMPVPPGE